MTSLTRNILTTALGGLVLMFCTVLFSAFFTAPPTRAEFDVLKHETTLQYQTINDRLKTLKTGQAKIIDHLLKE